MAKIEKLAHIIPQKAVLPAGIIFRLSSPANFCLVYKGTNSIFFNKVTSFFKLNDKAMV